MGNWTGLTGFTFVRFLPDELLLPWAIHPLVSPRSLKMMLARLWYITCH
jgi:hypothetical protein